MGVVFQLIILFVVREVSFGQKLEILCLHFYAGMKLHTQPATKNHSLLLIKMSSMHENCNRLQFHDVTLTMIFYAVCTPA